MTVLQEQVMSDVERVGRERKRRLEEGIAAGQGLHTYHAQLLAV